MLTTPVFDDPLFSPDFIILFEKLDAGRYTHEDVSQGKHFWKSHTFVVWGRGGVLANNLQVYITI